MKYLFILMALIIGCGDDYSYSKKPAPTNQNPGNGAVEFSNEVQAAIGRNCTSCHAGEGFITNASIFKAKGQPMVSSGRMPPGGGISQADKEILLEF